ncbi:MAG: DUF4363 family protein [Ruminococcaceae bacterium]|nr:DUF4363 family protein [Oscillospiraceae bacterium]
MKHLIPAVAMLLAVTFFCCINTVCMGKVVDNTSELITSALELAEDGKWNEAQEQCSQASDYWTSKNDYLGTVLNHNISDKISECIPSLTKLAKWQETAEFTALATEMLVYLEHIKEMERPSLSNIL